MSWSEFAQVFGGLGLFLLGMTAMTEALKEAAGPSLKTLLSKFTNGKLSAIVTGLVFTVSVQSSSATTLATIGFVNAGLLNLSQSLGVIYGANLGTTLTGWIVSLFGFKIKLSVMSLPLIGLGAFLKVFGKGRAQAIGYSLAGFGLLFLGIDTMQLGMADASKWFSLAGFHAHEISDRLLLVLIGALMTIVLQASAAALAITLTAMATGIIELPEAAALAIGQNLGTTITALLGSIAATANAKRAAVAHVAFNFLTGIIALILFIPLIDLVIWLAATFNIEDKPSYLAIFHTTFNVMGVVVLAPFIELKSKLLGRLFHDTEEFGKPVYLDRHALAIPEMAIETVEREYKNLLAIVDKILLKSVGHDTTPSTAAHRLQETVHLKEAFENLINAISEYLEKIEGGSPEVTNRTFALLRVAEHLKSVIAQSRRAVKSQTFFLEYPEEYSEDFFKLKEYVRTSLNFLLEGEEYNEASRQLHEQAHCLRQDLRNKLYYSVASAKLSSTKGLKVGEYINAIDRILHHLDRANFYWFLKKDFDWNNSTLSDHHG